MTVPIAPPCRQARFRGRALFRPAHLSLLLAALLCASCSSSPATRPAGSDRWQPAWRSVAAGIDHASLTLLTPPLRLHFLRVELGTEGLEAVVTPAENGIGTTRGRRVSAFAREFDCAVAVNATPFSPVSAKEGEARTIVGLSMAGGLFLSRPDARFGALVGKGGKAAIGMQGDAALVAGADWGVGGFSIVLRDGLVVGKKGERHPRAAAGVSADGQTLYLLIADGRQLCSFGLTEYEIGAWLAILGADDGLNLDGGGSTALALRRRDGTISIVNSPIHGGIPGRERVVGNCLGFRAH